MGYESRIFVVNKYESRTGKPYGEKLAVFDMCKCDYEFVQLFDKKTDCEIYEFDADEPIQKDKYGDELTECDLRTAYLWLAEERMNCIAENKEFYRRYSLLYSIVSDLMENTNWQHENIVLVHYGY